ncbi:MAG: 2-C-methyl-D-erythritol 4-phosphate cytidylyltransferase, partial [Phycisphaerales bacterium]|nr:2-C-methyl-D-erythritol 4-phosphate cytidylyltransferase [Phycisphaerales bacterium]
QHDNKPPPPGSRPGGWFGRAASNRSGAPSPARSACCFSTTAILAPMKLAVIIAAGGKSTRFANDSAIGRSKLDEDLGGRPVLQRTVELFCKRDDVDLIVVAGPADGYDEFVIRHGDKLGLLGVKVCKGGETHRWETVQNALEQIDDSFTHIAVHDAARPCTPPELIDRMFEAAQKHDAVVPGVEVHDTLKRISDEAKIEEDIDPLDAILGDAGKSKVKTRTVTGTVDRAGLVAVQTPQVFSAPLLRRAYAQSDLSSTDDAGLVERVGEEVVVIEGDPRNIKITRGIDLKVARSVLGAKGEQSRAAHKRF